MSTDREDCYNECKDYVLNCEFLFFIQDMIFNSFYNNDDTDGLINVYDSILESIEKYENLKYGRILYDSFKFQEDIDKLKSRRNGDME